MSPLWSVARIFMKLFLNVCISHRFRGCCDNGPFFPVFLFSLFLFFLLPTSFCPSLFSCKFSIAIVRNYHKLGGFKQNKFIFSSQLWRTEILKRLHRAAVQVEGRAASFCRFCGRIPLLHCFRIWRPPVLLTWWCIPCITPPFDSVAASTIFLLFFLAFIRTFVITPYPPGESRIISPSQKSLI